MEISKWWEQFQWAIAGLIGAVISVPFQRDVRSAKSIAIFIFTGSACAHFLTGMVGKYFNVDPSSAGGIGFLLGAFGGSMIAAIIRAIEVADLWALIRQRFGGGSQ